MNYNEAISYAILRIGEKVTHPVRLLCDIREKSVVIYLKEEGKWVEVQKVYGFEDVTHNEVDEFILGAVENED